MGMGKSKDRFIEERHDQILNILSERRRVSVKELCDHFGVSLVTIRNDLKHLKSHGKIIRTHGGALTIEDSPQIPSFLIRKGKNTDLKQAISKFAAGLINDGEVIFIDGGTTASEMPPFLI
jgi:DeoR/GlpR family transcriptional regulator of sugar metabolism